MRSNQIHKSFLTLLTRKEDKGNRASTTTSEHAFFSQRKSKHPLYKEKSKESGARKAKVSWLATKQALALTQRQEQGYQHKSIVPSKSRAVFGEEFLASDKSMATACGVSSSRAMLWRSLKPAQALVSASRSPRVGRSFCLLQEWQRLHSCARKGGRKEG